MAPAQASSLAGVPELCNQPTGPECPDSDVFGAECACSPKQQPADLGRVQRRQQKSTPSSTLPTWTTEVGCSAVVGMPVDWCCA